MARIPTENELNDLYSVKKQSLSEIGEILGFKQHKIIYWMDKYGIKRRSQSDSVYIKLNPLGDPYKIKNTLSLQEERLKSLALGIYWGEGNKTTSHAVRVTNSDPGVIRNFIYFLRTICSVKEEKIKYYLQTFKDNNIAKAKIYWSKELNVDPILIRTCTPIHSMGKGTYKNISMNGVMTVAFFNMHLKKYIMNELRKMGMK